MLHSTNQFYKWHSELEAAFASETEEKYRQYAADLQGRLKNCAEILSKVSVECQDTLQLRHPAPMLSWHGCIHDARIL